MLTVGQLKKALEGLDDDMPVLDGRSITERKMFPGGGFTDTDLRTFSHVTTAKVAKYVTKKMSGQLVTFSEWYEHLETEHLSENEQPVEAVLFW